MNQKLHKLWSTKNKNDEWWSSFVTAPLAIIANCLVVDWKWLSPNKLTLLSFFIAVIATFLILKGGVENFILAAILIHLSHILDCMDGQMARYRNISSEFGSYADKITDQIQVLLWFGAIGYAAFIQTQSVLPIILTLIGISFYTLRGYAKYIFIYAKIKQEPNYLKNIEVKKKTLQRKDRAGLKFGFYANFKWFIQEQRKILSFDEGVFIFMLSAALVFDALIPMLCVFAISQLFWGLYRSIQRGWQLYQIPSKKILTIEK